MPSVFYDSARIGDRVLQRNAVTQVTQGIQAGYVRANAISCDDVRGRTYVEELKVDASVAVGRDHVPLGTARYTVAIGDVQVLRAVQWEKRPGEVAQLRLFRGDQLAAAKAVESLPIQVDLDQHLTVREIRNTQSAEERLVIDFYRLWVGRNLHRPTPTELEQAKQVITEHGVGKSGKLLPIIVRQLKQQWPSAKTFAAAIAYLPDAVAAYDRQEQLRQRQRQEQDVCPPAKSQRDADADSPLGVA